MCSTQYPSSVSGYAATSVAAKCPEPLCPSRCYPLRAISWIASEGVTPPSSLLRAHAPDHIPPRASACALDGVFAGCRQSLLGDGPSRRYLRNPCVGAWTPTPRCSFGALIRFFPENIGLTPRETGSAHAISRQCNFSGDRLSRLQSFDYVQAPMVARPPGCSHRALVPGSQAVYATQWLGRLLPRTVVSLHVRIGQLSWRDFHPLGCSLVGCSLPHPARQVTDSLREAGAGSGCAAPAAGSASTDHRSAPTACETGWSGDSATFARLAPARSGNGPELRSCP